jgi:hypothetical protein
VPQDRIVEKIIYQDRIVGVDGRREHKHNGTNDGIYVCLDDGLYVCICMCVYVYMCMSICIGINIFL